MTNLDSILKSRGFTLLTKVHLVKAMVFSSSHIWMWELDYKESWAPKNWCFWTVVLGKTLESPLDCKEIQPVYPKGNQSWIFIGMTDAEAETPILWPPDTKNWLTRIDPDAGKDWGGRRRGWQRTRWLDGIPTQRTWVWVNFGSLWWTGRPGVLHSMGLQSMAQLSNWTELNWTLSSLQVCNTVLLARVTMLYVTFSGLIYFITGNLSLLTPFSYFPHLHLPFLAPLQFVLCLWRNLLTKITI